MKILVEDILYKYSPLYKAKQKNIHFEFTNFSVPEILYLSVTLETWSWCWEAKSLGWRWEDKSLMSFKFYLIAVYKFYLIAVYKLWGKVQITNLLLRQGALWDCHLCYCFCCFPHCWYRCYCCSISISLMALLFLCCNCLGYYSVW